LSKIIYIHNNYEPEHFPAGPDEEDRFYTYGFGSNFARNFKRYFPEYEVEMWRLDSKVERYYENVVQGVLFRIFPAFSLYRIADFSFKFLIELKKEIRISSPVLFVSHTHYWLLYQIAYFFWTSPILTSHHGDFSPFYRMKYRKGLRKIKDKLDAFIERKVFKNVDGFLVCDYNAMKYIELAAPNCKVIMSSTGLNSEVIEPIERLEARKQLGWNKDRKYLLYVGRLYNYKQPVELINIWKAICRNRPEVELVVIGNNEDDEFCDYAKSNGAMVLGRINNRDINLYYSAADVYVLLALREDYFGGTGIAPLESLACNTPVVSYSMRNYVGENMYELGEVPATLEEYKNAILKVLDNPQNYKNMRKSVEKYYSYERIAERSKILFEELFLKYNINHKK
jgi:glycosyltransferase involved in cell wall biosynthesis